MYGTEESKIATEDAEHFWMRQQDVTCDDGHPMRWFDGDSEQEPGFVHDNAADIVSCSEFAS